LASDPFAIEHDQGVIDPLEAAFVPEPSQTSDRSCSTAANRLPR
jgi:hypothetical protein